jgi:hypothetical protein
MENQKLMVGENWYFLTFTMPNLNLKNLELPLIGQIMQCAWRRFCSIETRTNKRQTWFQKTIRGGFKDCEFTYTENDVYHYHIHSSVVAKSSIQRDGCLELRTNWTKALRFAFDKFGVPLEINTKDGLAVVNLVKVDWRNREKTISELCKYVTKSDSWSKIPIDQLETIVAVPRLWRMFESFGCCRQTAQKMNEKTVETSANAEFENANESANVNKGTYLDQKNLNVRRFLPSKRQRRVPWRQRVKEIPFWQYRLELADEIEEVQRFRKLQLKKRFPYATFQTLDGEVF